MSPVTLWAMVKVRSQAMSWAEGYPRILHRDRVTSGRCWYGIGDCVRSPDARESVRHGRCYSKISHKVNAHNVWLPVDEIGAFEVKSDGSRVGFKSRGPLEVGSDKAVAVDDLGMRESDCIRVLVRKCGVVIPSPRHSHPVSGHSIDRGNNEIVHFTRIQSYDQSKLVLDALGVGG